MRSKILWIILSVNLILTAVTMNFLPDEVPLHYNMEGAVDRYGSKYEMFTMTALAAAFVAFWQLFVMIFERKARRAADEKAQKEASSNARLLVYAGAFQTAVMTVIQLVFAFAACNVNAMPLDSMMWTFTVLTVACGIGEIVLGNILPKTRRNSAIGVRTTWSMKNDAVWAKSNRFGGTVLCVAGVATAAVGFAVGGLPSVFAMLGILLAATAAVVAYSYFIYKQEDGQK